MVVVSGRTALVKPMDLDSNQALCRTELFPDAWFPDGKQDEPLANLAKEVCGRCPIKEPCLRESIVNRIPYGVFGGINATDRDKIIRGRS